MEALFQNSDWNAELREKGYKTFGFLGRDGAGELLAVYRNNLSGEDRAGFHASMFHADQAYRKRMDEAIRQTFGKALEPLLSDGFRMMYANFMVKEPGAGSDMRLHQDWSYVDESAHDSFAIWVPLTDLTPDNGALEVFPCSHLLGNQVRGPGIVCPFHLNGEAIRGTLLEPLYLKAGEAVIWHHRLAHASPENRSQSARVAATAIIVPREARIFHYFRTSLDQPVEQFEVDREFFMQYEIQARPKAPLVSRLHYDIKPLSMQEMNELATGKAVRKDSPIIRKPSRRVFLDESRESEFNDRGYITMNLLDEPEFARLMALLNDLKGSTDQKNVNLQSEYELSFFNRDANYRKKVVGEVYGFFKPYLDNILDNYEPLIVNLFNKKPGSGEVPIHQNWTFVDEQEFTTVSVWIPLCDVSRKNGTLEVVPRTHNTLSNYRSPSIPWVFEGLEEVLKEKYLQPLELKRGQIGILDDAILHWSSENNSDHDRATIQLIMKPKESQALHYYCEDLERGELSVYKVDSDFFASFEMHERPKRVPIIAKEYFHYHRLSEEEFLERIH